jgi:hypothetical protein
VTLTTASPPAAGIYWQAVVLAAMSVNVEPNIAFKQIPDAGFNIAVVPSIAMLPPQHFGPRVSPLISMAGGSRQLGSFGIRVTPRINWIPSTAFDLTITPALSMTGNPISRGNQLNVAVTRSATY